jgi:hypothetical protein
MRSEFKIGIKQPRKRSLAAVSKQIRKEPVVRQYLVLAEQVKQVLTETPVRSMREIAKWLGYSPARLSQIYKLTFLATHIKEEILLSDDPKIFSITTTAVCKIANEADWEKQLEMWGYTNSSSSI